MDRAIEYVEIAESMAAIAGNITNDLYRSEIEGCNACRGNGE